MGGKLKKRKLAEHKKKMRLALVAGLLLLVGAYFERHLIYEALVLIGAGMLVELL